MITIILFNVKRQQSERIGEKTDGQGKKERKRKDEVSHFPRCRHLVGLLECFF